MHISSRGPTAKNAILIREPQATTNEIAVFRMITSFLVVSNQKASLSFELMQNKNGS